MLFGPLAAIISKDLATEWPKNQSFASVQSIKFLLFLKSILAIFYEIGKGQDCHFCPKRQVIQFG